MASQISPGAVHHLALTVTDVDRARRFYSDVVGLQVVATVDPKVFLGNGTMLLALGLAPNRPVAGDRFDENRVGLDHISFNVGSRADLERAAQFLSEKGVPHGEIKDLAGFRIYVLAFRDPDNIQVELTAPYAA
jgi:catechol 2,3-dioxygenase-like lactoylglutathione lyase family enzyme